MDWILELRHEALTPLFLAFTFLGDPTFFIIFLPLGYWLYRRDLFYRLGLLLFVSGFLSSILKAVFQMPRPDVVHLVEAQGWSFPSGHAQIAAALWPWLAFEVTRGRKAVWPWVTAAVLVLGVAASRVYLGVHYPRDVAVGIGIGLLVAAVGLWLAEPEHPRLPTIVQGLLVVAFAGLGLALVAALDDVDSTSFKVTGGLVGFWLGAAVQGRFFDFTPPKSAASRAGVIVLGLAVAFGLRLALKTAFPALGVDEGVADFARYLMIAAWLSCAGPWVFRRLRWMDG